MLVYIILIAMIIIGQILLSTKIISKKIYCIFIASIFILVCGLRHPSLGMWDTESVYLPSFRIIKDSSLMNIFRLPNTQYRFVGFVFYSKLIGLLSSNDQFYIFMMAWPFYVCVTYLVYKYVKKPYISFLGILGLSYLTFSFALIRGMMAYALCALALDAFIQKKNKKAILLIIGGATFHISALAFLVVFAIKKIRWSMRSIIIFLLISIGLSRLIPIVMQMSAGFISKYLPTYNYYFSKGGDLWDGFLYLIILMLILTQIKYMILYRKPNATKAKSVSSNREGVECKIRIRKRRDNKKILFEYDNLSNLLISMTIICIFLIISMISLTELLRVSMTFGVATVLLIGENSFEKAYHTKNKMIVIGIDAMLCILLVSYFFLFAVPNMNAYPYKFFWMK